MSGGCGECACGGARLAAMCRGDEGAARAVWAEHAGRLMGLARAITGCEAAARDAVQEAFVGVLGLGPASAGGVQDEAAYLAGAVRMRALNMVRGAERRARREGAAAERGGVARAAGEEDEQLQRAVDGLALELREVVALKHLCGLTFDQIAVVLGVARGTAASRYASAVERLRVVLGESQEVARANG